MSPVSKGEGQETRTRPPRAERLGQDFISQSGLAQGCENGQTQATDLSLLFDLESVHVIQLFNF